MSDPNTVLTGAQAVSDAAPYVNAVVGAVISALGGFIAVLVKKYIGISIDQAMLAKVEGLATQYAAAEVAKAADNLATRQIDVKSPMVKSIADQILVDAPKELDSLGLGPDEVKGKVTAAFGQLQAQMTAVAAPAALPPAAAPAKL
ncbi:MAG: hypothetical protein P4L76_18075 [Beijerinckiaceae bacterium]|nr:hypothetical protein [Beijerinckiaceae bacterium]